MRTAIILLGAVALSACGSRGDLQPAANAPLPVKPFGAVATPTPADLTAAGAQARPERSDELLRNSEKRKADDFDLPPT